MVTLQSEMYIQVGVRNPWLGVVVRSDILGLLAGVKPCTLYIFILIIQPTNYV
jgi:hypothetical protein